MALHPIDIAIVALYVLFALGVGLAWRKRASSSVESYFISERTLPWWLTGTSMIATSFAADTPLVITGWVREFGLWKNWLWWCYALSGLIGVFFFARLWRRSLVMTKAELVELRYGGRGAVVLRFALGMTYSGITNVMVLCWVLLAASKILDILLGIDPVVALGAASLTALAYSLLAGLWGVVITDFVQLIMASIGAVALAIVSWLAVGGREGLSVSIAHAAGRIPPDVMSFWPPLGSADLLSPATWTPAIAAVAVYLGVAWWAVENVDGSGIAVQRLAASRDERHGVLAYLWFNVAHYALRPWPWIVVALASLIVLPSIIVTAPVDGRVVAIESDQIVIAANDGERTVAWDTSHAHVGWRPIPQVEVDDRVQAADVLAATDSERAYVSMLKLLLPVGLLGLTVASLLAAFMSTIDTHMNLASSFFVNDVFRRFLVRGGSERMYVRAARVTSAVVLAIAMLVAWQAKSISGLFLFFLSFLAGVGPVYLLRWFWWRITAVTEITALLASGGATIVLTRWPGVWQLGPLSPNGELAPEGRLVLVVLFSFVLALGVTLVLPKPDPRSLRDFYERVRPRGAWGPVRRLSSTTTRDDAWWPPILGAVASALMIFGTMVAVGRWILLGVGAVAPAAAVALAGMAGTALALRSISREVATDKIAAD